MVNVDQMALLEQILALLDTACQAGLELLGQFVSGNQAAANQLLDNLLAVVGTVQAAQEPLLSQLEHAYTSEMLENVEDTLVDIRNSMQISNAERAAMKTEFQLFPFLRQLKEAFYFWGMIYPDKALMDRYYQEEFAKNYRNLYVGEDASVRLSIVVTGYNHLETTKQCVQQLLRETDFEKLHAELILIDHGSTDGTLEYFESLGVGKVIHFKKNVRMYMFSTLSQLCQGQYFCFISNDILVTKNWAEILLTCLESDNNIIAAVPATPNIANFQGIDLPGCAPEEFVVWASRQNKSDPARWNDRARLMPPLGMYRTAAVSQIGFADPYFYSMEYWDDDFSLRARRAGYRQIVCDDVACYHFGSVTGKENQIKEDTLIYGRELFLKKNKVDAWGNGFCYDYTMIHLFKQSPRSQGELSVLGIDCGMGDIPLQIRNELRHIGQACKVCQITSQRVYLPDIEMLSDGAVFSTDLAETISSAFEGQRFLVVCLGRDIAEYENSEELLAAIAARLAPGGHFIFFCKNPFYAVTIHAMLRFSLPDGAGHCALADPAWIRRMANGCFSEVQMLPLEQRVDGIAAFAEAHYGKIEQLQQIVKRLGVEKYYFVCRK